MINECEYSGRLSDTFSMRGVRLTPALVLLALAPAAEAQNPARDWSEASLEDLMNIEVTTVSKKEQKLAQAPAAVYVLTQEDIRRSGMTSVPDLLRMVPGLQVAQVQGGPWAISARGFNDQYSNKLLVLVDGRSAYEPISAGVSWEEMDMLLEDIERIEVIRGPGASLWGANAVNGVINIITRTAKETQGALVTTGGGDQGQALAGFRYGGELGRNGYYRASVKYLNGRSLSNADGRENISGESSVTGGFRADWTLSPKDSLTAEAGYTRDHAGTEVESFSLAPPFAFPLQGPERNSAGDVMVDWTHRQSGRSSTELRIYYDHRSTSDPDLTRSFSTVDVDFEHHLRLSESNDLVWGLGFRDSASRYAGNFDASVTPDHRDDGLYSGFIQDQITVAGGRVSFILGTKLEHNNYTGAEIQPGGRLLWTPDKRHTLWLAVSRAVRTPSALDFGLRVNLTSAGEGGAPLAVRLTGSPSFRSEDVLAYELGYRFQAWRRFSFDLATFYNVYRNLRTSEPGASFFELNPAPAHLVIPLIYQNQMHGEGYGGEIATNWNVTERWRLIPSYSWLRLNLRLDPSSLDTSNVYEERENPQHQFQIRSNLDVSRRVQFDAAAYYVSSLPYLAVAAYTRLDARLGYKLRSGLEISLAGQNLQGGRHAEFVAEGPYTRASIARSVFARLTWGF